MNRKVLKFEIDLDFVLIAITSSLKDYRLCYHINKQLGFNLIKTTDLQLGLFNSTAPSFHSLYRFSPESSGTDFYFIGNKGTEGFLIPEMGKTDFWLMIRNYIDENDLESLLSGLNKIPEIVSAVKVDPKKIKSRENLLF